MSTPELADFTPEELDHMSALARRLDYLENKDPNQRDRWRLRESEAIRWVLREVFGAPPPPPRNVVEVYRKIGGAT